jgi:heme-degrading monooxygenase HmoA
MFIAMNRFRVKKGSEKDFEQVWLSRDTHLTTVPGFVEFPKGTRARGLHALFLTFSLAQQG